MVDTSKVEIYRQVGISPNPSTDQLLGTDMTIGSNGEWEVSVNLGVGRHKVYAVSVDLAGNRSQVQVGEVKNISKLPCPMYVSETIDWYIGELANIYIGTIDQ